MDAVVIGAGLSGLTAAALLASAGAEIQVLEAMPNVGGRIQAVRHPTTGQAIADLGPTWVWPKYQPLVVQWLEKLGLSTFNQFDAGDAVLVGYGPNIIRQPLPAQDGISRIKGGPSALIDALAKRVGSESIRLSAIVEEISDAPNNRVGIRLVSGERIVTQHVILAIPLRVAESNLKLAWAPQVLLNALQRSPTWMSTHAKAIALFDQPFWRRAGLSGRMASRIGPLAEAHDHSGAGGQPAAIFGFVGWPPDARKSDPEGLQRGIVSQLAECFGDAASAPVQLIIQDWASNPYIASWRDLSEPAAHPEIGPQMLRQSHLNGAVRFAVSETSDISPGLIEGALAAGQRAALDLLGATL